MPALRVAAGPRARRHLRERGLRPSDVAIGDDVDTRVAAWSSATADSQRLADEFAALTSRPGGSDAEPL